MDLQAIDAWDVGALEAAISALTARVRALTDVQDQLRSISALPGWEGDAAAAARDAGIVTQDQINRDATEIGAALTVTRQTADAVVHLKTQLQALRDRAAANALLLLPSGKVVDLPSTALPTDPVDVAARNALKTDIEDVARALIAQASDIDSDAAQVFANIADGSIAVGGVDLETSLAAGTGQGRLTAPFPPEGASAEQVNAYWDALPEGQRAEMIGEHPELIGNLDGIPSAARSEANISRIPEDREQLEKLAADLRMKLENNMFGGWLSNDDAGLGMVEHKLADLDAIEQALREDPEALLTVYDMTSHERGLAAIAIGNPDVADHITVTTPGLGTNVGESMGSMTDEATQLGREMRNQLAQSGHGDQTVANIAWIGYQPPELGGVSWWDSVSGVGDVSSDDIAEDGGAALASYYQGLDAASDKPDPHISAFGHSYGSLTTSEALQQGGASVVDDAVLYGSPGLNAQSPSDMGMPYENVWVMDAEGDHVTNVGRLGPFSAFDEGPYNGNYQQLSTADAVTPDGVSREGAYGHSGYPRSGDNGFLRTSGYNLAVIGIGRPDLVVK
ncbi:alpha/beta hydrolase [Rhodococcoides kyotonense]|uniref:Alpha/beta hydrolase n=1 Tax=Rhodococcoides kyotonense TaxID=398843 RepID=A0A239LH67_9NOCA|nr:alpha/beta hydrolase [Rhodococcus kyotonensis]SNT29019.1 Alpha/beta hydrolase [Rhodococcus kyotonensis]